MSKIKFYLHKFDKQLSFQLMHIDESLLGKSYLDPDTLICVGANSGWGNQFDMYKDGANFGTVGRTTKKTILVSGTKKGSVLSIYFPNNEERDYYYEKIIEVIDKSIKNDLWIRNP